MSHLQYSDDIIILEDPMVDNVWTIKAILMGFELSSSLSVNFFSKSNLICVKVDHAFLETDADFLHYTIETNTFKYLGLPVGEIPNREVT